MSEPSPIAVPPSDIQTDDDTVRHRDDHDTKPPQQADRMSLPFLLNPTTPIPTTSPTTPTLPRLSTHHLRTIHDLRDRERYEIKALHNIALWPASKVATKYNISASDVLLVAHAPPTPRHRDRRGRRRGQSEIDAMTRKMLVLHATSSAEQRRKPLKVIAAELGITDVTDKMLREAFAKEGYGRYRVRVRK